MLPEEIDKTLRTLGDDGEKVRGALERDFAAYAKQRAKDRSSLRTLLLAVGRTAAARRRGQAAAARLFSTDDEGFQARLEQIRDRAKRQSDHDDEAEADGDASTGGTVMEGPPRPTRPRTRPRARTRRKGAEGAAGS